MKKEEREVQGRWATGGTPEVQPQRLHLLPDKNSTACEKGICSEAELRERPNSSEFTRMK